MKDEELLAKCETARQQWLDAVGDDILEAGVAESWMPFFGEAIPRLIEEKRKAESYKAMVDALSAIDHGKPLMALTERLDEHPEGYEGPCLCHLCQSYA